MTSNEIREKYLKFFISSPRAHREIVPAPLVLEGDPTTLFTSAGMQPLIPYLKGKGHPKGKRLVDSQPSIRLQDIEEVGDNRHITYFEMLGNWSLGDYFKKEQIPWIFEFFTKELNLPKEKLWVSVFEGYKNIPKDEESFVIWKKLGIPESRIFFYGVKNNWWNRGEPFDMPVGEIGGPDSEIFFDFGLSHNPEYGRKCHPNCNCGRFLEIGNSVFMQYVKNADGSLSELSQKNVDFGGGLERITAAVNRDPDIFKIDIYQPQIKALEIIAGKKYGEGKAETKGFRVIADHLRAASVIAKEGVVPGNKLQGYILRRLIRRAGVKMHKLQISASDLKISGTIGDEINKFEKILASGTRLARNMNIKPFDLYQSYGIPLEITQEIFALQGRKITDKDRKEFEKEFNKHRESSRTASAGMFKGGLADTSEEVTKLHTTTHLLHASLRKVLDEGVSQKGSNITAERLRFDFSYPRKLTDEELTQAEDLINLQIAKDLPVSFKTMGLEAAIKLGALHFFAEKYGKQVKVYSIGDFSKEVCGGPHVTRTGKIGRVRIIKQEKTGADLIRIYVGLEGR
ncbi:alanine--tRNA ligase [Candidatus Woesebacteria bacterium CG22_combo_CG10-13_8_21_14_all_45_10]|uniref:alanine--tRNA ligase n=2 Tax=Candidatus Woeseibacteriota TaxID=1752722 RepID=A0A2H0BHQ5_9BACT|nr:MAG: alanine--tRNA ligase [Candidatus Woesebacteria bacterium CG22_combo_CG10-13_8_21_14_all_45_10]